MEVRAQWVRMSVEHVQRLSAEDRAAVAARLPPGELAAVDDVSPFEWLPVERLLAIDEAIAAVTGIDNYGAVARAMLVDDFTRTLVGPLFRAAMRVTGVSPAPFFRVAPIAYRLVTRGCGQLRVEAGAAGAARAQHGAGLTIVWSDAPARLVACEPYVVGIAKGLEGMLAYIGHRGSVTHAIVRPDLLHFEVAWGA